MTAPQGLKSYQTVIAQNQLYSVNAAPTNIISQAQKATEQLRPNIEIGGGNTADVLGSQILPEDPATDMPEIIMELGGIAIFDFVPNYLFIKPTDDDIATIVLTGINVRPLMLGGAAVYAETHVSADGSLIPPIAGEAQIYAETYVSAEGTL